MAYFISQHQFMRVVPLLCRTVVCRPSVWIILINFSWFEWLWFLSHRFDFWIYSNCAKICLKLVLQGGKCITGCRKISETSKNENFRITGSTISLFSQNRPKWKFYYTKWVWGLNFMKYFFYLFSQNHFLFSNAEESSQARAVS